MRIHPFPQRWTALSCPNGAIEGEGCAPLPGGVFSALSGADGRGRLSSAGARRMRAARGGSGGSSSPWKLWQPGSCLPTELGVRQPNPPRHQRLSALHVSALGGGGEVCQPPKILGPED